MKLVTGMHDFATGDRIVFNYHVCVAYVIDGLSQTILGK